MDFSIFDNFLDLDDILYLLTVIISFEPGNTGKQGILMSWEPGNMFKSSFLSVVHAAGAFFFRKCAFLDVWDMSNLKKLHFCSYLVKFGSYLVISGPR